MTTSLWPTAPDNLQSASSPAILASLTADSVNAMQAASTGRAVTTPAFASGTKITNASSVEKLYCIATATAGAATVVLTDLAGVDHTVVTSKTLAAVDTIELPVPAGFGIKITLVTSTCPAATWLIY